MLEYIAPASAVSFVAPSQQFCPAYTAATVTTGVNLDAAVEGSASQVIGSLPHGEVFSAPVFNQVHQEQLAGGEIPENLVEIPVVHKQVIVQASPHVVGSLPPVAEFTSPMYNPVHQEQFSAGDTAENFAIFPVVQEQVLVGMRPAPPSEVAGPQGAAATGGYVAAGAPLLVVASLAGRDDVDGTTVSFLLAENLKLQKKVEEEEKERRRKRLEAGDREEISLAVHEEAAAALERARLLLVQAGKRRKRKKRRKRRTPRTSSIPGRTRRRQRQWFACSAGFTGDDVPRVMFPSGVVRPKMPRIMASLVQKDSCSGMASLVLLVILHLALYPSRCSQAHDASHHGWYGTEGQLFGESLAVVCILLPSRCVPFFVFRPKMPVFMAGMDTGAFLGQGFLHARCCATCCATVQTVQYTVWRFRSYSSSRSSHPRRGPEAFPMAQAVQQTIEIPLLPFRRFCCAGSASSLVAGVEKTAVSHIAVENTFEIPQLQLVDAGLRTRLAGSTGAVVEKTVVFSQFRPDWCSASVCKPAGSTGAVCEETVDIPLLLLHAGFAVH